MTVRVRKNRGRYNLMRPNEYQWLLEISGLPEDAPARAVSATFDDDDEPMEDEGTPPAEVAETIADDIEHPLFSTGRERDREVISWIRENEDRVNADWASRRIEILSKRRDAINKEIESLILMAEALECRRHTLELNPCPFCGNAVTNDEGVFPTDQSQSMWEVRCGDPSCWANSPESDTRAGAIMKWNQRRANPVMLAALREAREQIAQDRQALFDCVSLPSGIVPDDGDNVALARYNRPLATIDAAIQQATGGR